MKASGTESTGSLEENEREIREFDIMIGEIALIAFVAWLAGMASFAGGVFARLEGSADSPGKRELIHGVVAFGGGILVAAVAFALAPEGMKVLSPFVLAATFALGGIVFCIIDAQLSRCGGGLQRLPFSAGAGGPDRCHNELCGRRDPLPYLPGYRAAVEDAPALDSAARGCPGIRRGHDRKTASGVTETDDASGLRCAHFFTEPAARRCCQTMLLSGGFDTRRLLKEAVPVCR